MPERRMFAKTIIDSDAFLDMPLSTQALYFHLSMRAEDDGFVSNPRKVQRMIGCADDDLKLLIAEQYLIAFESGTVVIKHWRIHNYIRADRYKPTLCQAERQQLDQNKSGEYELGIPSDNQVTVTRYPDGIPSDNQKPAFGIPSDNQVTTKCQSVGRQTVSNPDTRVRLERVSTLVRKLDNNNINNITPVIPSVLHPQGKKNDTSEASKARRFTKPTVDEVRTLCADRSYHFDPQAFIDHYESNGWRVGRNPMKDWKAAASTWERGWKERNRTTETRTERAPKWG